MSAVMLVVAVLLVIHTYFVVNREIELFHNDMELRTYLIGSVLTSSVADVWKSEGPERVMEIIEDANRSEGLVRVRWVWLDTPKGGSFAPQLDVSSNSDLRSGREVLYPKVEVRGAEYSYAYFPVRVDSTRVAALELAQPLEPMHRYIRSTILRKIVLFAGFLFVGTVVVWWLGAVMVGRSVQSMVSQARKVGEGDLDVQTSLGKHRDELAELAQSMNQMVDQLRISKQRLQEETDRRIETIKQLDRAERLATVGKLASGLAHELGTPLNVVSGRAKMIAGGELGESEVASSASVIREQSERMTRIIRQLLDFARSHPPQRRDENVMDIAAKTVATLKPIAEQSGVILVLQPSDSEVIAFVDREKIHQVLSNLLVNAIHAMPNGGDIDIAVRRELALPPADIEIAPGEVASIRVKDHGVGIEEKNLEQVFTPFFSTKGVGEGTGLGLSIVHGIIKEHGGWISVESEVGKGSCFTIYLPLVKGK